MYGAPGEYITGEYPMLADNGDLPRNKQVAIILHGQLVGCRILDYTPSYYPLKEESVFEPNDLICTARKKK